MSHPASDRSALIRLASSLPVGNEDRKTILTGLASSPLRTRKAGRVPSNAPQQVKQVAKAWVKSAIRAGEELIVEEGETGSEARNTRKFWKDRLFVDVDDSDKGPRWIVGGGKYTSKHRPWVIRAVYGPYEGRSDAMKAERALKKGKRGTARTKWAQSDSKWCRGLGPDDPRVLMGPEFR